MDALRSALPDRAQAEEVAVDRPGFVPVDQELSNRFPQVLSVQAPVLIESPIAAIDMGGAVVPGRRRCRRGGDGGGQGDAPECQQAGVHGFAFLSVNDSKPPKPLQPWAVAAPAGRRT